MATVTAWKNVAVALQSAIAGAKTITAISSAAEGQISSTAHGYSGGDYILLSIQGMWQLDNKVVRVKSGPATDTWVMEGIDTTGFSTFTSGTAQKLTFGTTITTIANFSTGGGDFSFIDTSTIHGNVKTSIPGAANAITYTMEHLWDPTDAGQIALKAASDAQAQKAIRFTFGTGGKIVTFAGYVGFTGTPGGTGQDKVTTSGTFTQFGSTTYYAS
jgi:hypothetical protein